MSAVVAAPPCIQSVLHSCSTHALQRLWVHAAAAGWLAAGLVVQAAASCRAAKPCNCRLSNHGTAAMVLLSWYCRYHPNRQLVPPQLPWYCRYHPNLAKASGSDFVEQRIRRLRPDAHVFGHT